MNADGSHPRMADEQSRHRCRTGVAPRARQGPHDINDTRARPRDSGEEPGPRPSWARTATRATWCAMPSFTRRRRCDQMPPDARLGRGAVVALGSRSHTDPVDGRGPAGRAGVHRVGASRRSTTAFSVSRTARPFREPGRRPGDTIGSAKSRPAASWARWPSSGGKPPLGWRPTESGLTARPPTARTASARSSNPQLIRPKEDR
jgi:hypothetical protein